MILKPEREIFMELFNISVNTYYLWKKEGRPIISLLEKYFSKENLEEFLQTGNIQKLDSLVKLDSFFNSFSLEIQQKMSLKLNITGDNYSFYELDEYVGLFFYNNQNLKIEELQLKILKHISNSDKLSQNQKISYIAAIGSLTKMEFFIISKYQFLY